MLQIFLIKILHIRQFAQIESHGNYICNVKYDHIKCKLKSEIKTVKRKIITI